MPFHLFLVSLQAGRLASHHILDFGILILDFFNPNSLAQTFCNDITFSPNLGYRMINIVLWSPLRQGGPQSEIRNVELLSPVVTLQ